MDPVQALSALGSVALILGIVVAVVQVRILTRQRQDEIVMRLHAPLYGVDLTHAYWYGRSSRPLRCSSAPATVR